MTLFSIVSGHIKILKIGIKEIEKEYQKLKRIFLHYNLKELEIASM